MISTKGQSTLFGHTGRQDLMSPERPSRRRSSIQRVADLAGCVSMALRLDEELESSDGDDSFSSSSSSSSTHSSRDKSPSSTLGYNKKTPVRSSIGTENFAARTLADNGHRLHRQCDSLLKQAASDDIERGHHHRRSGPAPAPPPNQRQRRRASVDCCANGDSLHDAILQSLIDETKTAKRGKDVGQQRQRIKLIGSNDMLKHPRSKPRSSSCDGAISSALSSYHDSRDSLHQFMMESIRMREEQEDGLDCKNLVDGPHFGSSQFTVCDGLVVLKSSSRRRSFSATGA